MTDWEEKLATHKTTRKSVMKTPTSGGSRCITVEVNRITENYKTLLIDELCTWGYPALRSRG